MKDDFSLDEKITNQMKFDASIFPSLFPSTYLILMIFVLIRLLEKFLHSLYKNFKKINKLRLHLTVFLLENIFRRIIYQLFFHKIL